MKFTHDVIVIGGGAGGLTAAGGCALFGLKVALIEGHTMGGECLNNGCVPSTALPAAAKRAAATRSATARWERPATAAGGSGTDRRAETMDSAATAVGIGWWWQGRAARSDQR